MATGVKVLCTCLPGFGHFLPLLPLAEGLRAAGHDVVFATAADFCPKVSDAGFEVHPAGLSLADQLSEAGQRYPEARLAPSKERFETFVPRMLAGVAAPARVADLVELIDRLAPDVVVHDETELAAPIAAEVAGVPYADQSVGILRPLRMARLAGQVLAPLCERWGVDVGPFAGLFRYLYLDVCPPSLQSEEIDEVPVAAPVHNLSGPADPRDVPPWLTSLPPQPTVYVSLGTIFNQDPTVFAAILEGIRDQPLNVIVTVGQSADPSTLGHQPANVRVERYIPQAALLPFCDLVVNQGGTAIFDILGHGLPLLLVPQGANQFHNAEACARRGVGRALPPGTVSAETVRDEVRLLLDDPSYLAHAREVHHELRSMPGPPRGVELIERLAEERRPITGVRA